MPLTTEGTQVIGLLLGSSKNVFEGTNGRQAFSVVGVINHGSPRRGKGSASHTKTLMETTSRRNQLSPLPEIEPTEKVHNVKWINNWVLLTG